jgi:hypothetical protein
MLPFRVIQIEQHRALQQNAAKLPLRKCFLLTELSSARKIAKPNRPISDPSSDRNFVNPTSRKTPPPTLKNEPVSRSGCTTSSRFWPKNGCYRKQTIKPCLTGARTHFRQAAFSGNFPMCGAALSGELRPYWETPRTLSQSSNLSRAYGCS